MFIFQWQNEFPTCSRPRVDGLNMCDITFPFKRAGTSGYVYIIYNISTFRSINNTIRHYLNFYFNQCIFFKLRSVFVKYSIEIFIINKPCEELKFDKFTNKKNYWNYHIIILKLHHVFKGHWYIVIMIKDRKTSSF